MTVTMNGPVPDGAAGPAAGGSVPTYYLNPSGDGIPVSAANGIGTDSMIVLAGAPGDESLEANIVTVNAGGRTLRYDLTSAQRFENWDAGLVAVPEASIEGVVWEDADYDGVRSIPDASEDGAGEGVGDGEETGGDAADGDSEKTDAPMPGESVVLTQWYFDPSADSGAGAWLRSETFGLDQRTTGVGEAAFDADRDPADKWAALAPGEVGVLTGEDGIYRFDGLPSAYTDASGAHYLAAYRVRLLGVHVDDGGTADPADDEPWLLTKAHIGDDAARDSDVLDGDTLAITDRARCSAEGPVCDGQIILAGTTGIPAGTHGSVVSVPASLRPDGSTAPFDWLTLRRAGDDVRIEAAEDGADTCVFRGGDAGELPAPRAKIDGIVWHDANSNGVQDDGEAGVSSGGALSVKLVRYLPDAAAPDGWAEDASFAPRYDNPGEGGYWCFEDLPSSVLLADGARAVCAYRASVEAPPDVRNTYFIAKYRQGSDYTLDSDLRYEDASLMDIDSAEYDVLLDGFGADSFAGNLAVAPPANNPNHDGGAVAAAARIASAAARAAGADAATYRYDFARASDRSHNDGGVEIPPSADIAGVVWDDANYDGFIDEGEPALAGKTILLKRWVYDAAADQWDWAQTIPGTTAADGSYRFDTMPVATRLDPDSEVWSLNGYTIEIDGTDEATSPTGVGGRPLTLWQQGAGTADEPRDSKVVLPEGLGDGRLALYDAGNYPVALKDSSAPVVDGRLVLARRAGASSATQAEYVVGGFDMTAPASREDMNAGFGPFTPSTLRGVVWDDANYDGVRDFSVERLGEEPTVAPSSEVGIPGVEIRLTRYWWDGATWSPDDDFAAAYGTTDGVRVHPEDPTAVFAVTDGEGVYEFPDLPGFIAGASVGSSNDYVLASYQVQVLPGAAAGGVPTRFHAGAPRVDSDATSGGDPDCWQLRETYDVVNSAGVVTGTRSDGYVILANPSTDARSSQYALEAQGLRWDPFDVASSQRGGDAGVKRPEPHRVAGRVWEDADDDGVRADDETGIPGVVVELRRYWLDTATGRWHLDNSFGNGGVEKTQTDEAGQWSFEGLPAASYLTADTGLLGDGEEGRTVLYGYRANLPELPEGFEPASVNCGGDPLRDSDLDEETTRILPDEGRHGLIVLARPAEADEDEAALVRWAATGEAFSLANLGDSSGNDAGLVPDAGARIEGRVWNDADLNGIQNLGELPILGGTAVLERRPATEAELGAAAERIGRLGWTHSDGAPGSDLNGVSGEPVEAAAWKAPAESVVRPSADPDEWVEVDALPVNGEGRYAFDRLAQTDEAGWPWVYRVRLARPEGALASPAREGQSADIDSDWLPDTSEDDCPSGASGVLGVVVPRSGDDVNAYGQLWLYHRPADWVDEPLDAGRSVDFGFTWPPTASIAGMVWNDDDDGLRAYTEGDGGEPAWREPGIEGVTVELLRYWYLPEDASAAASDVTRAQTLALAAPLSVAAAAEGGDLGEGADDGGESTDVAPGADGSESNSAVGDIEDLPEDARWVYDAAFNDAETGEVVHRTTTDEEGTWEFDGLPLTGEMVVGGEKRRVVYGYRVHVPELPEGFEVAPERREAAGVNGSQLNEATKRVDPASATGGLTVLASQAAPGAHAFSLVPGGPGGLTYSLVSGASSRRNGVGLVPARSTEISGVVWSDANSDGLRDEEEETLPGLELRLERRAAAPEVARASEFFGVTALDGAPGSHLDAAGEPLSTAERERRVRPVASGEWQEVARATTDGSGAYSFADCELSDGQGNAWVYRIVADRPEGAMFVAAHQGSDDNRDSDLEYVGETAASGATGDLPVATLRPGDVNAYGQTWQLHRPNRWTAGEGRSVDIGWHWEEDDSWITRVFFTRLAQTGDELALGGLLLVSLIALSVALTARRRRRAD